MKIGSLCTGYGGLDMAVEAYFNAETVWCAEIDKYASQLIKERFDIPNYGDIKSIQWADVEPIDILTAGYPCQPFSHAGDRKGLNDDRHIFPFILEAISALRPRWVVLENVRGHLSLGLKEVLAGLTQVGYDARWQIVRASDVGAPHQRARIFIVANAQGQRSRGQADAIPGQISKFGGDISVITNPNGDACAQSRRTNSSIYGKTSEIIDRSNWHEYGGSSENVSYTDNKHKPHDRQMQELGRRFISRREMCLQATPNTLDQLGRLNPEFVEYMMGLPKGWVTDMGLSRSQQLKMLGNGVVPQQAFHAINLLMEMKTPC